MCWYDGEVSAIWNVTERRARKTYPCYECDATIERGQKYQNIASLYDGRWGTYRLCIPCVTASEALGAACRLYEVDSCNPPIGGLRDALDEHLRDEGWRTGHAPEGLARTALRDLNRHNIRLNGRRKVTA